VSENYGRCGTVSYSDEFPRDLTSEDVNKTYSIIAETTCAAPVGKLTKACTPDLGPITDGKVGGGVDTPVELPGGTGNKPIPGGNELAELDGILYLSGKGRKNNNNIECSSGMNTVNAIMTCDFRSGNCEPTDKCGGPFPNGNGDCKFPDSYFVNPGGDGNYCNNNDCEYKIKIQFILKDGQTAYPTSCKIR
jgi:hypothetical protein